MTQRDFTGLLLLSVLTALIAFELPTSRRALRGAQRPEPQVPQLLPGRSQPAVRGGWQDVRETRAIPA